MKTLSLVMLTWFTLSTLVVTAQYKDSYQGFANDMFLDTYQFNQKFGHAMVPKTERYTDIEGSPYLDPEFRDGLVYMKDTTAVLLPLRFNLYTNEMEYQFNGVAYSIGNPRNVRRIVIGPSQFIHLTLLSKDCYVELLDTGRCQLLLKRSVRYKPGEGPRPIIGTPTPAEFVRENDQFYLRLKRSEPIGVSSMKSVILALQDRREEVEKFISDGKIHRPNKENLLKVTRYYNSLAGK